MEDFVLTRSNCTLGATALGMLPSCRTAAKRLAAKRLAIRRDAADAKDGEVSQGIEAKTAKHHN